MPKLFLHAGTHKTGTTALQSFAVANRAQLLERGLLYPDYAPLSIPLKDGHHQFAHSLAEVSSARMAYEEVSGLPAHWLQLAREHQADVLISVESMYRHCVGEGSFLQRRRQFLERVATVLSDFDIEVVLVYRRPDDFARSLYQEIINSRTPTPTLPNLADWLNQEDRHQVRYHESASLFREVFPRTRVRIYEDCIRGDGLYVNFFGLLGVDVSDLPTPGKVRKSLNAPQTVVKNYANDALPTKVSSDAFVEWLQTDRIASTIERAFGGTRFDLWQSHEERQAFLDSRATDLEAFRESFFPERGALFPQLQAGDTLPPVPEIPDEIRHLVDDYLRRRSRKKTLRRFWSFLRRR